jgi:hypothetical protein
MLGILAIPGLIIITFTVYFVVKGHREDAKSIGIPPVFVICPDCGGDGGLLAKGNADNRHFVRIHHSQNAPTGEINRIQHKVSREHQGHMTESQVWDCRRCGNSGWIPKYADDFDKGNFGPQ